MKIKDRHILHSGLRAALLIIPAILAVTLFMPSCSTTKRLGDGEILYNGMKLRVHPADNEKIPEGVISDLNSSVNVKPNNAIPLLTPYRRYPFPLGLWVWNLWPDTVRGVKRWIYDWLADEPVLISNVRPDTRTKMLETVLQNNGYFGSTARYELKPLKNPKIANVIYDVNVTRPYLLDSIIYLEDTDPARHFIDSMARKSKYLVKGERFCVDSLRDERVRIANAMRNKGYYFFRPEYIEYLADTLLNPYSVALKLTVAENTPDIAMRRFRTRNIITTVMRRSGRNPGIPDTMQTSKGELIVYRPAKLRAGLVPGCITFRKGKYFSVRDMDRTQTRLSRLGIFSNIQMQAIPADTTPGCDELDLYIACQFDRPMEASIEANVTSTSNSYFGPGLIFSVTNNNVFGGAERLSVQLKGSYEWQTGSGRSNIFNSYEFGLNASLAFPRLLAPKFVRRTQRDLNWTTIDLGADLLNRPHFFRMAEFHAGISYEWNYSRRASNQFTPFKLTFSKLIRTTHEFDSIMGQNPAVALSFQSQFIPEMSYTYNYERWLERSRNNGFNFTLNLKEGGNIFWALWRACGVKGEKRMFGMPFSQFIRGQAQLVYSRRLIRGTEHWLVSRILVGAEHAYGNSSQVPYAEQFYIGGANSIRAFTVRSLGPGSYHAPKVDENGYFDQTGTFKLEFNTEYRFPLISILHGALFVDAGNIWLLKDDPLRPGGLLTRKNFWRDIALGTGVGLRVDVGMMVIRGDLGYGLHAPYDTGVPGYFNIPFKRAFAFHLAIGYPF